MGLEPQPQDLGRAVEEEMLSLLRGPRLVAVSLELLAQNEANTEATMTRDEKEKRQVDRHTL